jgi:hypothetical protein
MTMKRKMPASPSDKQVPARQIAALKRQVRKLKAGRDQYLQTIHAWAKEKISAKDLQEWMREEEDGGSLLELIATLRKES